MHLRSDFAQRLAPTTAAEHAKSCSRIVSYPSRCPQQRTFLARSGVAVTAAATEAQLDEPAPGSAAAAPAQDDAQQQQRKAAPQQGKRRQKSLQEGQASGFVEPIIVGDKPVTNAILRRLEAEPQAVLRAAQADDVNTYRALTAVASAQKQLAAADRVVVYVPYTKASRFTAQIVTADAAVTASLTEKPLVVRGTTDAAALGNIVAFEVVKHGGATLLSAGPVATAKAAEALRVARGQLLRKGYEIGVVPRFILAGNSGEEITVMQQQVVAEELPAPEVVAPSSSKKKVDAAAAAVNAMLRRQRRCTLKIRQGQLQQLTELMFKAAQPRERSAGTDAAEGAAQQETAAGTGRGQRQAAKQRLLLVTYAGTSDDGKQATNKEQAGQPDSTQPTAAEPTDQPAAGDQPTAAAAADTAEGAEAAASSAAATAPADAAGVSPTAVVSLELLFSRFTFVPEPRWGLAGPDGPVFARRPAVATAESSVPGLAGALESRLISFGAAWLYSDGTVAGNKAAWEAYTALARKLSGRAEQGSVLALVKVEPVAAQQGDQSSGHQGQDQQQQEDASKGQTGAAEQQGAAAPAGYALKMLVVSNEDVPRSLLQAPNAPLESSKVAVKPALRLIKFAAAANSFLPASDRTGTGGLVILPAVLPAAVDYRFADSKSTAGPARYDYFFRLQRFTDELKGGIDGPDVQQLRVSSSTDPSRLRDAIVAKMMEGQAATLRFLAPVGVLPNVMLSVAMTAVAAARVRLQSKSAGIDVGVMPHVLAADGMGSSSRGAKGRSTPRVVYSLRLVPMPAAVLMGDAQA